jgi:hypothetical protein
MIAAARVRTFFGWGAIPATSATSVFLAAVFTQSLAICAFLIGRGR